MPKYLARYTIRAGIYDGGCFMQDPEHHKREYGFKAPNKEEARELAKSHKQLIAKEFFGVRSITLDSLLEVKNVKLQA